MDTRELKLSTIKRYTTKQIWRAVMRRDSSYSHDGYGAVYRLDGNVNIFHASYSHGRRAAIEALVDCDGAPMEALRGW